MLDVLSGAAEADQIISFEVPAVLSAASKIWQNIVDIATLLVEFLIEQVSSANSWQQIASGARGLPQNMWPVVEEGNSDIINVPENWTPQTA